MSEHDTLQALRAQGAHLHDPVRFRYLEALAERMPSQAPSVQRVLARKFDVAAAGYRLRMRQAHLEPLAVMPPSDAAGARSPLAQLNRYIAQRLADTTGDALANDMGQDMGSPSGMRSVRQFAETWSTMACEQQLAQALTRGPELAGPLNSHNLMLRAMSLMHGLSPDYLRRFLAQADALLWLDHMNHLNALNGGKTGARRGRTKK